MLHDFFREGLDRFFLGEKPASADLVKKRPSSGGRGFFIDCYESIEKRD
jgi:hypothetical protein